MKKAYNISITFPLAVSLAVPIITLLFANFKSKLRVISSHLISFQWWSVVAVVTGTHQSFLLRTINGEFPKHNTAFAHFKERADLIRQSIDEETVTQYYKLFGCSLGVHQCPIIFRVSYGYCKFGTLLTCFWIFNTCFFIPIIYY